jgi:hypothetical protein
MLIGGTDYQAYQNYVGQTISYQKQFVHCVCPKHNDLSELMAGLLSVHQVMKEGAVPAIIHAAAISCGFVFMHPFEDGNGRIHGFPIQNRNNVLNTTVAIPFDVPQGNAGLAKDHDRTAE